MWEVYILAFLQPYYHWVVAVVLLVLITFCLASLYCKGFDETAAGLSPYSTLLSTLFFAFLVQIYAWLYDEGKSSYVSHIYRLDKYGVVINYALFTAFFTTLTFRAFDRYAHDPTRLAADAGKDFQLPAMKATYADFAIPAKRQREAGNRKVLSAALALLKIGAFNFIFANHTADFCLDYDIWHHHSMTHSMGILALFIITLVELFFSGKFLLKEKNLLRRIGIRVFLCAVVGARFLFVVEEALLVSKSTCNGANVKLAPEQLALTGYSVFLESCLIGLTFLGNVDDPGLLEPYRLGVVASSETDART